MNRQTATIALLGWMLCLPVTGRTAVIDVMVVFEQTAFVQSSNRQAEAAAITANANNALAASGLGGHLYNLKYVHTLPVLFASNPSTRDSQTFSAMGADPQINQLRDQQAADLVVMVSEYLIDDQTGNTHCGAANIPHSTAVHIALRNTYFRAVLQRGCLGPATSHIPPHELGHLLSADHELTADPSPGIPVRDNHPHWSGDISTLMVTGTSVCPATCNIQNFYSDPQANYPGSNPPIPRSHSYDRNNRRVINAAFPVVAAYRPEPPPPATLLAPTCALEFVGCSNGKRRYLISWYQNDSQPFPVADADYSINGGSTWYDLYGGLDACVPIVPATLWHVRARIRSAWGDSGYCTIQIQAGSCSGGDL